MPGPLFEGSFVLAVVTGYLLLLFGIGHLGERKFDALRARGLDRYVYVFAAGVYCTSWTFYGCIGNAATVFLVIGSVPYISLQLRAVAISYDTIVGSTGGGLIAAVDPMLPLALFLAAFALFFGGRYLDFTRPRGGVLTAVATESVVKLDAGRVVSAFEKRYIEDALRRSGEKLIEAARLAGMDNKNFSEKMKRHGVTLDAFKMNPLA